MLDTAVMEKQQTQPVQSQADHEETLDGHDGRVEDFEAVQHIHWKTIVLLIVRSITRPALTPAGIPRPLDYLAVLTLVSTSLRPSSLNIASKSSTSSVQVSSVPV